MRVENLIISLEEKGRGSSRAWHRQVFTQIRDAIRDGRLRSGDRLPPTRELALTLGLARNTIARAYEDLLAEGYVEGRVGSGTYVSAGLGELPRGAGDPEKRRARSMRDHGKWRPERRESAGPGPLPIDFRPGTPDWDAFPRGLWLRLLGRALRANSLELRRYGEPGRAFPASGSDLPSPGRLTGRRRARRARCHCQRFAAGSGSHRPPASAAW